MIPFGIYCHAVGGPHNRGDTFTFVLGAWYHAHVNEILGLETQFPPRKGKCWVEDQHKNILFEGDVQAATKWWPELFRPRPI